MVMSATVVRRSYQNRFQQRMSRGGKGFHLGDCISSRESPRRPLIPFHPDFFVAPRCRPAIPFSFSYSPSSHPLRLKWHKNTKLGVNQSDVMGYRSLATDIKSSGSYGVNLEPWNHNNKWSNKRTILQPGSYIIH